MKYDILIRNDKNLKRYFMIKDTLFSLTLHRIHYTKCLLSKAVTI